MIDADKYEGHTAAPWTGVTIDTMRQYPDSPTMILAQDAPLLLAEVIRLRKECECECMRFDIEHAIDHSWSSWEDLKVYLKEILAKDAETL